MKELFKTNYVNKCLFKISHISLLYQSPSIITQSSILNKCLPQSKQMTISIIIQYVKKNISMATL